MGEIDHVDEMLDLRSPGAPGNARAVTAAEVGDVGGFEALSREECLSLLAGREVGRLAVALSGAAPLVVPVNYVLDGESLVFRTGHGTKLRTLAARPVSFQVDEFDLARRTGWSVLARGRAREVSRREAAHLALESWAPELWRHWVRLEIRAVTGRRLIRCTP